MTVRSVVDRVLQLIATYHLSLLLGGEGGGGCQIVISGQLDCRGSH